MKPLWMHGESLASSKQNAHCGESLIGVNRKELIGRLPRQADIWGAENSRLLDEAIRQVMSDGKMRPIAFNFHGTAHGVVRLSVEVAEEVSG
ncbi:hypothetical protein [Cupriavidus sp. CuC1]|uniref:hypothetical protein n=1 Tax=Cupriavidus sp. CuC1 TaxID=3373131 RepID=UPI0037D60AA7